MSRKVSHVRRSPAKAEKRQSPDAPSADTVLEEIRTRVVDTEAFLHAACSALESLPLTRGPAARRGAGRVYALVIAAASAAEVALDEVDRAFGGLRPG